MMAILDDKILSEIAIAVILATKMEMLTQDELRQIYEHLKYVMGYA